MIQELFFFPSFRVCVELFFRIARDSQVYDSQVLMILFEIPVGDRWWTLIHFGLA